MKKARQRRFLLRKLILSVSPGDFFQLLSTSCVSLNHCMREGADLMSASPTTRTGRAVSVQYLVYRLSDCLLVMWTAQCAVSVTASVKSVTFIVH